MKRGSLLRKELDWSRHRLATVVAVFVVLPAVFATGTVFFQQSLPEHSPVAVVPQNERVSQDDLAVVQGSLAFVSDPTIVDSSDAAFRQLDREEVYAVVAVPPNLTAADANATVDVYVSGGVSIYRLPSRALTAVLGSSFDGAVRGHVTAERHFVGREQSLSAYLLPTFLMVVVMLLAFTFVPYTLTAESSVYDRLRVKTTMTRVVGAKLAFFPALVVASVLTAYAVGVALGYPLEPPSIGMVAVYLGVFVGLAALATAVMFLTGLGTLGRIANAAAFIALLPLSNLVYPVGFFSPLSRAVARANPVHYAMIVARSLLLKDVSVGLFANWLGWLALWLVGSLAVLRLSVAYYEYTR
ncbi:MAG: ABC transporter permease [Haloarculaceae archaeon]